MARRRRLAKHQLCELRLQRVHTHYDTLTVARDAPPEVIHAAYRSLCQTYHPDRNPGDPNALQVMIMINAAYKVLSDPVKRGQHDEWIRQLELEAQSNAPLRPGALASPPPPPGRHQSPNWRFWPYWLAGAALILYVLFFLIVGVGAFDDFAPWQSRPLSEDRMRPELPQAGAESKAAPGPSIRRRARQPEPAPRPPAFPNPSDIPLGLERATLLATFGQPTLKTMNMDQNRPVETFVYVSRDRNRVTSILLRDGLVISASTSNY